jgi:hypothetical protein
MDPTLTPRAIRPRGSNVYNADVSRPLYAIGADVNISGGVTVDSSGVHTSSSSSADAGGGGDTSAGDQTTAGGVVDEPPWPGFPAMVAGPVGADGTRCGINGKKYFWDDGWPCNAKNQAAVQAAYYSQSAMSRGYAQTQLRNIANFQAKGMVQSPYDGPGADGEGGQSVWLYQLRTGTEKLPVGLPYPGSAPIQAQTSAAAATVQKTAAQTLSILDSIRALQAAAAKPKSIAPSVMTTVPQGASQLVSTGMSTKTKVALGLGALALVGGAVFFVTRKKGSQAA